MIRFTGFKQIIITSGESNILHYIHLHEGITVSSALIPVWYYVRLQNQCENQLQFPPERSHLHSPSLSPPKFLIRFKMADISPSRGLGSSLPVDIGAMSIQEPQASIRMTSVIVLRLDLARSSCCSTPYDRNKPMRSSIIPITSECLQKCYKETLHDAINPVFSDPLTGFERR